MTRHLPSALFLTVLAMHGCAVLSWIPSSCPESYADPAYALTGDITRFPVPALHRSPAGVPIGPGVNGALVDQTFKEVAACLHVPFHACAVHAVMIAPVVVQKENVFHQMEEVFPCAVDTRFCPGVNQYPATIIITPDHHALRWEIERLLGRTVPHRCQ